MNNVTTLQEALYDKSYTCPLCNQAFKSKAIKSGKNQLTDTDIDLYAHYSLINPLFYHIIICPECGYAFHTKWDTPLPHRQKELLKEQFHPGIHLIHFSDFPDAQEAITKHKMALLACITKKGKISEQSYIALNIAWLYRDLKNPEEEKIFLRRAYDGFNEAFSTENFPIAGMDELTLSYLLAAIGYEIGEAENSKRYLTQVLTAQGCPPRIKDRALTLKEKLLHT